ncbi:MAG: tRNA1(Val) (adenine(37)-N6)-methyltransferase [Rhodothalassiaceae bacterium]
MATREAIPVSTAAGEAVSEDRILGGRLRLLQPRRGARVAIDTMLLAAAVSARPGERVIEAGSGSGAAALAVACRCPGVEVTGIEIAADLVAIANRSAALNGLADRVRFLEGDITERPLALGRGQFDHAFANPPYLSAARSSPPPHRGRARAYVGGRAGLADWIDFCLDMVREKGGVTFVHRVDHLDAILARLHGRAGEIVVCPLWPREGVPAKRILVHARKGMRGGAMMVPGIVLHAPGGGFTDAAEAVLRGAQGIDLTRRAVARLAQSPPAGPGA